jgi:hypothetical protein
MPEQVSENLDAGTVGERGSKFDKVNSDMEGMKQRIA